MSDPTLTSVGEPSVLHTDTHTHRSHYRKGDGPVIEPPSMSTAPSISIHATKAHKRTSNRHSIATMTALLLLLAATAAAQSTATAYPGDLCSCSPREYFFKLNLSATCPPLPPPYPPNDVFGGGVDQYTCSIGPEPIPSEDQRENGRGVRSFFGARGLSDPTAGFDDGVPPVVDPEPVVIDSIQFFELDTMFRVINQDPSYVRGVEFLDGDIFNYTSVSDLVTTSGKEANTVPGGINMILRGYNANGERVMNKFTITFTNECGVPTFEAGEEIGWVVFDSFVPASEETCGPIEASIVPTPSPSGFDFPSAQQTPAPSSGEDITSEASIVPTPSPSGFNFPTAQTPAPSSGEHLTSARPNDAPPTPAERTPAPTAYYGPKKPTRRPTSAQSKPDAVVMSYDFNVMYSKFRPVPKVHKEQYVPREFSYQFHQGPSVSESVGDAGGYVGVHGKSGKSSKSSSSSSSSSRSSKSSKSSRDSKTSKKRNDEPVLRHLRATLDRMDLDRGAKPSKSYLR